LLAAAAGQGKQADTASEVTICLHNSIVATPGAIERAKMVARSMFASVGVNISWRASVPEPQPALLVHVSLVVGESAEGDIGPLAEAFPFAGEIGHIQVRYDRVRTAAGVSRDLEPLILAHVLVHEITHVLQCLDRHADTGVMKARWTAEDYYDMRWKPLAFTPEDIELIHLGMQVLRSRAENHLDPAHLSSGQ
jgi:hypothetical protein